MCTKCVHQARCAKEGTVIEVRLSVCKAKDAMAKNDLGSKRCKFLSEVQGANRRIDNCILCDEQASGKVGSQVRLNSYEFIARKHS